MYTEEIRQLLEMKKYIIELKQFQEIMDRNENPQVTHATYVPDSEGYNFSIHTEEPQPLKVKVKLVDWSRETI